MALCPTNHTLAQGSLHYRLATLGYQKQNPDGVRQFANILCAALPFEMAIKSGIPMGFVNLQTSSVPALPFGMAIKSGRRWGSSSSQILQKDSAYASPLLGEGLGVRL